MCDVCTVWVCEKAILPAIYTYAIPDASLRVHYNNDTNGFSTSTCNSTFRLQSGRKYKVDVPRQFIVVVSLTPPFGSRVVRKNGVTINVDLRRFDIHGTCGYTGCTPDENRELAEVRDALTHLSRAVVSATTMPRRARCRYYT